MPSQKSLRQRPGESCVPLSIDRLGVSGQHPLLKHYSPCDGAHAVCEYTS